MQSNCILDYVVNLHVRKMVVVGNIQKSSIASHLKGLDTYFEFCCQYPDLTLDMMSVRTSLILEASELFLSLHNMIFNLERAAAVWAILERISGFDPSLEMIAQRYLKFSTVSSL